MGHALTSACRSTPGVEGGGAEGGRYQIILFKLKLPDRSFSLLACGVAFAGSLPDNRLLVRAA